MIYTEVAKEAATAVLAQQYANSVVGKLKKVILSCETYRQVVVAKRMLEQQIKFGNISYFQARHLKLMVRDKLQVVK